MQHYEDERKQLNPEEHKEKIEMQNLTVMDWAALKRRFSRIMFSTTATPAYSTG